MTPEFWEKVRQTSDRDLRLLRKVADQKRAKDQPSWPRKQP